VAETADDIARAWLEYGKDYAKYPSLWDSSLAFASGPLRPEGGTLRDYSGKTGGAVWSVGAGDVPKYAQGSVRGKPFWAGQYDGTDDYASHSMPSLVSAPKATISMWFRRSASERAYWLARTHPTNSWGTGFEIYQTVAYFDVNSNFGYCAYSGTDWTHVLMLFDGTQGTNADRLRAWINGTQQTLTYEGTIPANFGTPISTWKLSRRDWSTSYSQCNIASPTAFSRVLTPSEIAILAQHPLAAYETVRPKYWMFPTVTTNRRRRLLFACGA